MRESLGFFVYLTPPASLSALFLSLSPSMFNSLNFVLGFMQSQLERERERNKRLRVTGLWKEGCDRTKKKGYAGAMEHPPRVKRQGPPRETLYFLHSLGAA